MKTQKLLSKLANHQQLILGILAFFSIIGLIVMFSSQGITGLATGTYDVGITVDKSEAIVLTTNMEKRSVDDIPANTPFTLLFTIHNYGTQPAQPTYKVRLGQQTGQVTTKQIIGPGGRVVVKMNVQGLPAADYPITITTLPNTALGEEQDTNPNNDEQKITLQVKQTVQQQRIAPAISTQQQTNEGPISRGGIAASPQTGPDVTLNNVFFYYENSMSMWVDKDKLQPSGRLVPSVSIKNKGATEANNVEVAVSVDGGVEEKKIINKITPGGASGYGFFLPAGLEGGQHELIVRMTTKDDINLDNNIAKIPFTILTDGSLRNLEFNYVNDQRTVLSTPVDLNAIDTTKNLIATVFVRPESTTPIQEANVILNIDGQEQKNTVRNLRASIGSSFDIKGLVPGKHDLTFTLELKGDTNQNNNVVKSTITVLQPDKPIIPPLSQPILQPLPQVPQPVQPAVEQPKQQLADIVLELPKDDWLEQNDKYVLPSQLGGGVIWGFLLVKNKGTLPAKNVVITTSIDGEIIDTKKYDVIGLVPPVSTGKHGTFNSYTYSFGSGNKKWWPGKHILKVVATTDDAEISKENNVITTEITIAGDAPKTQGDIVLEKFALAQYYLDKQEYVDVDFLEQNTKLDERYNIRVRMYHAKDSQSSSFDIFVDGQKKQTNVIGASVPAPHTGADIGALLPGKHHLKIILDPDNRVYETNENNNVYETDFWVKEEPKDVVLMERGTFAEFNDAKAKQTGKNTIELRGGYDVRGKIPQSLPVTIKYADRIETKNVDVKLYTGGVTGKWGNFVVELPVDRNKFPTQVYVSIDFPEDANKENNALLVPVVIAKDGKMFTIS